MIRDPSGGGFSLYGAPWWVGVIGVVAALIVIGLARLWWDARLSSLRGKLSTSVAASVSAHAATAVEQKAPRPGSGRRRAAGRPNLLSAAWSRSSRIGLRGRCRAGRGDWRASAAWGRSRRCAGVSPPLRRRPAAYRERFVGRGRHEDRDPHLRRADRPGCDGLPTHGPRRRKLPRRDPPRRVCTRMGGLCCEASPCAVSRASRLVVCSPRAEPQAGDVPLPVVR